jgi:hypothetical protein
LRHSSAFYLFSLAHIRCIYFSLVEGSSLVLLWKIFDRAMACMVAFWRGNFSLALEWMWHIFRSEKSDKFIKILGCIAVKELNIQLEPF